MEIAMNANPKVSFGTKIINILAGFELSAIQKSLSDVFENPSIDEAVNHIGELNKNDVMF
ncbi:hypothetical protein IJ579_07740 [bacterium]|nr:hypothetical protein [bacterium]